MTSDITRLRSVLADVIASSTHREAIEIAAAALTPSSKPQTPPSRHYPVAETLADLTPDAWCIVGKQTGEWPEWIIPFEEVKTFQNMRNAGQVTSTLARAGDGWLILARRVRVPTVRRPLTKREIGI